MTPMRRKPKSRKAKSRKSNNSTPRPVLFGVPDPHDQCDCPACTAGDDLDPRELAGQLTASVGDLLGLEDPLDAEVVGAGFLSMVERAGAGEEVEDPLVEGLIPAIETQASPAALALLLGIGAVAGDRVSKAVTTAADRLLADGVPSPAWAAGLEEPVAVADCQRLVDAQGTACILACSFHRAGRSHAMVVTVDRQDCGAASDILLLDAEQLPAALEMMRSSGRDGGLDIETESLDPAEFRWQIESALDARAVHDRDRLALESDEAPDEDGDGPDYHTMALLLRSRTSVLPESGKPKAPHGDDSDKLAALQALSQLVLNGSDPFGAPAQVGRRSQATAKLPRKRKKSDGPVPVCQIKVDLRGAEPPIWRRLEVPGDITLARLHMVIQVAFDWDDSHMHVFETPCGQFGFPDRELGHRSESAVTLEQVAPKAKSKIRYTYDFGDNWEHDILVEKVLDRDDSVTYPRCTDGRRAAPPDDCGGVWGYSWLLEVLDDPDHPDHDERLEWLGLDNPADFDPAEFDPADVTQVLAIVARW